MNTFNMTRRQWVQAGALALGTGALTSVQAQPSPVLLAQLANLTGQERLNKLVEGARKEGQLSIYTSMPVDDIGALTSAFEQKYGVKSKVWRSGSEKILQRGLLEARAKRYEVDVFETNGP